MRPPISKIIRAKWIGGMVQAVEHLLCKGETLNSNGLNVSILSF
jgi:hypothetical protein